MKWEVVVGLETHTQLSTVSKIFSGTSTRFGAEPNTQASPIDLALPGTLPVLNRGAVERAIRLGLAIGATIAPVSVFARKNYFYPDLPKGYQISQFERPIVQGGTLSFMVEEDGRVFSKIVRITRAHLEEDAGKSLHQDFAGMSGIDLNRAGTPLLEIVSEPDLRSSAEAVAYARALHALVVWLGICDGNMQEGSFRCDANVSVRPAGETQLGTRCEIKNLNSFRFLQQAIDYEVQRHIEIREDGGRIRQETRLYDPDRNETRPMRSKEDADDYRYFPDPDLPALRVSASWVEQVRQSMPELPSATRTRFAQAYALSEYDAHAVTASRATATFFETAVRKLGAEHSKLVVNWIMGDVASHLRRDALEIEASPVSAPQLANLLARILDGTISGKIAKDVFEMLWEKALTDEHAADQIILEKGLKQISDTGAIEKIIDDILHSHPAQLADYRSGKDKLFGFFVGQVMKAMQGKANPQQLNDLLRKKLAG
ncbi:MAG: Asp-tRNA(Asn)/Glu-tRNA(Gln) amidotransferase subunit GatB [Burkholderiaceae bacterium]|jgi:aspartyl-tRNA(Asn)/glutamyl-tRNA(Gln) amidotransferase subunit B